MAASKDIPRIKTPPSGDGHHVSYRYMNATELAEREARQNAYEAMLERQEAFEQSRTFAAKGDTVRAGCVFAKSCKLPDAIIDYSNPSGMVPVDRLKDYGEFAWLGASDADAGLLNLLTISGSTVSLDLGRLALRTPTNVASGVGLGAAISATGAAFMTGMVALLWTSSLADSALYTDEQLRALDQARTRVRLRIEQRADGVLKGYAFYTGKNRDWEMVNVVRLVARENQYIADLGKGIELIWTPVVDGSDILGIPALEAAPKTPPIWVYPPTKAANDILVNPVYPPEYDDFILVFPESSGIKPVYIVVSVSDHKYYPAPRRLSAYPDAKPAKQKTRVKGRGTRMRWKTKDGLILEWDYQHGAVEMYDKRGRHLGEFDADTGEQNKPADPTRRIEP